MKNIFLLIFFIHISCSSSSKVSDDAKNADAPDETDTQKLECTTALECKQKECNVLGGCIQNKCVYVPVYSPEKEVACIPDNLCYAKASCNADGQCITDKESLKSCDDSNVCTEDSCDPATGNCSHKKLNETACDDSDKCTGNDKCVDGVCAGKQKKCDDSNACTSDSCDSLTGGCVNEKLSNVSCDDNDKCTLNDMCVEGVCTSAKKDCDDKNPCTDDSCEKATGLCIHDKTKDGTECDDNDFCTENEQCQNKVCKPFKFIDDCCHDENDCDDYDSCTNSKCDPAKHLCVYEPIVPCCGNGIKEDAEECDDKNSDETDGCSSECKFNTFILSAGLPDDRIPVASSVALSENNDRFLVVVNTFHNKSSKGEIWGKLVDLNGNTIKGLFKIDDETTESHFWPDAASGTGGGFIAAWRDGYHTRIKSITHEGDVIEKETVLQSFTAKNKPVDITELIVHRIVSVSAFHLDDTEKPFCVLVAWMQNHSDPEDSNGKNYNVHFSILKQNSEGILSIETTPLDLPSENKTFRKLNPLVLDDDNDSFLVMWTTQDSPDNDHWENRYMKIKCDGSYEKETLVKDHKGLDGIMPFLSGAFSKSKGFYLITYPFYNMKSSPGEIIISGKVLNSSLVTVKNEFEIYTEKTPALSPVSFITGDGSFISTFIILGGPTSSIINYVATDSSFTPVPVKLELTKSGDSMNFGVDTASYPEGGFFSVWLTNSNGKSHIAGRMIAGK